MLGEQSLKTLRGKLAEDVVFAGSDLKARLSFAEVTATFDNTDKTAPIEYPEIILKRRIFRSGESEYYINESKARLQDILLFLAKAHVGQRSYSVIGQGMIDHIFALTPEARKAFFDEATGVKEYQIKRDQALLKMDSTRENLKEVEIQLAEIEPRLRSLTRQRKRLEEREEVEKSLRDLQRVHFTHTYAELQKSLSVYAEKKESKEGEVAASRAKAERLSDDLETIERETTKGTSYAKLNEQYQQLYRDRANLLGELEIIRAKKTLGLSTSGGINLIALEEQRQKINTRLGNLESELAIQEERLSEARPRVKELQKQLSEIQKEKETLQKRFTSSGQNTESRLIEEWGRLYKRLADLLHDLERAETLEEFEDLRDAVNEIRTTLVRFHTSWRVRPSASTGQNPQELNVLFGRESKVTQELVKLETEIRFANDSVLRISGDSTEQKQEMERVEKTIRAAKEKDSGKTDSLFNEEEKLLIQKREKLDRDIERLEKELSRFQHAETEERKKLIELEKTFRNVQDQLRGLEQELSAINIELVKFQTRMEELERMMAEELPADLVKTIQTKTLSPEEKSRAADPRLTEEISKARHQMEMIGGIDEGVIAEHSSTAERFDFLSGQVNDLQKSLADLEKIIRDLDETIHKEFSKNFRAINEHFEHYFKMLFRGGVAKLILEERVEDVPDELDETQDAEEPKKKKKTIEDRIAGIDIKAVPPGKKISSISMLSGGERSLTAIALICAIISANPSPFVVLDEVDAALDEANSYRFASILEELSHKTQFIVITHNRATMEKSQVLYGVTMGEDGISKILSIKLEEAAGMAKTQA